MKEKVYKKLNVDNQRDRPRKNENDSLVDVDLKSLDKTYLGYDISKWLNSAKIRCKKSTYSNYQYTVNARILPKFARVKKKMITSMFIDNYTDELLSEGLLPKRVKDILIILKQILNYAGIDIKVTMPKVPKSEIQILTKEEQLILEKELFRKMDRIKFGIYLCLYVGLRIGEICALRYEDILIDERKIKVRKTITRIKNPNITSRRKTIVIMDEPKSISSIREIPLPEFIIPKLKEFTYNLKSMDFLITGNETFMETRIYFNKYKKIIRNIKIGNYNFHALRHTFATRCIENGCDPKTLSEILGHSNVKITLDRYVHPNYENKVRMINQLKPMWH